jgi:hypothetical protein
MSKYSGDAATSWPLPWMIEISNFQGGDKMQTVGAIRVERREANAWALLLVPVF